MVVGCSGLGGGGVWWRVCEVRLGTAQPAAERLKQAVARLVELCAGRRAEKQSCWTEWRYLADAYRCRIAVLHWGPAAGTMP